eukprot:1237247-Pyramimonas_sp.AAC.1
MASMDIDKVFLKGLAYRELAEVTGEKERMECFTGPLGSASMLRALPGVSSYDEIKRCFQCLKPGTGTKDAPTAFSLKVRTVTRGFGLKPLRMTKNLRRSRPNLLTAKHVDDINMAGVGETVDKYVNCVKGTFGAEKVNKHCCTNCAMRFAKTEDGHLRLVRHPELTVAAAEERGTKTPPDTFISLRGALANALITQVWLMVCGESLPRAQEPTNLHVRSLRDVTRKLQQRPNNIIHRLTIPTGQVDLHSDSGNRRLIGVEDDEATGYGIRGANLLLRGHTPDDILEFGGLSIKAVLTLDAESVCQSSSSKDSKKPTECTAPCWGVSAEQDR